MQGRETRARPAPTIYDVAKRAGVSISTVSLALNSPARVRADTLQRVQTAVRELGFIPSAEAAARARRGTRRVGVLGRFSAIPSLSERLRGLLDAAAREGYEVVVYEEGSVAFHPHLVDSLSLSRKLDGLILMDIPITDRLAESLDQDGLPTVLIEYPRPGIASVVIDNHDGGRLVGEYLAAHGYTRCAFLGLQADPEPALQSPSIDEQRLDGYRQGLSEAGLELDDRYVRRAPLPFSSREAERGVLRDAARVAATSLFEQDPPPNAIFASSDLVAAVALSVARKRGLRIPDDVAIVGFDDADFAAFLELTTVRQQLFESGREAFGLLHDCISADGSAVAKTVTLPLEIVSRATA